VAGKLHHGVLERAVFAEDGRDAVHPLSAGYADPDGVAVLQRRNDRDHPGDREIGIFGLVDGLGEDELDRFEMGWSRLRVASGSVSRRRLPVFAYAESCM